jgi:glucosylceramidase
MAARVIAQEYLSAERAPVPADVTTFDQGEARSAGLRDSVRKHLHATREVATAALAVVALQAVSPFIEVAEASSGQHVELIESGNGKHLAETIVTFATSHAGASAIGRTIRVNDNVRYQKFEGVGLGFTGSMVAELDKFSAGTRYNVMKRLFGDGSTSVHAREVRIPLGASDFSANGIPYTYDDMPAGETDPTLSNFSIAPDNNTISTLQMVKSINPRAKYELVPWSYPAWMKANGSLNNVNGAGSLLPSFYSPAAEYIVKSVMAYEKAGIPINTVVPANEPGNQTEYPGMEMTAGQEILFINKYLRPALDAAGLKNVKIGGNDLSWGGINYAETTAASHAVNILEEHCYDGSPFMGTILHNLYPNVEQGIDECGQGIDPNPFAEEMIAAIKNWSSFFNAWNGVLDPNGNPVQGPNSGCHGCKGLVTNSAGRPEFNSWFDQLAQLGGFVQYGAKRVETENIGTGFAEYSTTVEAVGLASSGISAGIDDVAFRNPNGTDALVVYNNSDRTSRYKVAWHNKSIAEKIGPHAMETLVWKASDTKSEVKRPAPFLFPHSWGRP